MLGASLRAGSPVFWRPGAVGGTPAPTPTPTPAITKIVIEGDSITSTTPLQTGYHADFYSHSWAEANPALTSWVTAQGSRSVGGAAGHGDLADAGSPGGNTLLAHQGDDLAYGAQLLSVMIGTNDFGTQSLASYKARLIAWAGPIRAAGTKILYAPPPPLSTSGVAYNYAGAKATRDALMADVRDPAVWSQWADYYNPMGEHVDFNASDNSALFSAQDGVHPTGPVAGDTGQARLYAVFSAVMATLLDAARAGSTQIYPGAWPASETNLATSEAIVRRFIVRGLAHAGLALTGDNALSVSGADAQLRRAGGAWGAGLTGWLYNGDVIDVRLTTSAGAATATSIDLTVGSETRTLSFATAAAVTPASLVPGGILDLLNPGSATQTASVAFPAIGLGIVAVSAYSPAAPAVTYKGVACTLLTGQHQSQSVWVYSVPVADTTAGTLSVTLQYATGQSAAWFGTLENVDAVAVQTVAPTQSTATYPISTIPGLTVPSGGIALGFLGEAGNGSAADGSVTAGTPVDGGYGSVNNGYRFGLVVAKRTTSGSFAFDWANYDANPVAAVVFKALGT